MAFVTASEAAETRLGVLWLRRVGGQGENMQHHDCNL
jgi:hypothetical protein